LKIYKICAYDEHLAPSVKYFFRRLLHRKQTQIFLQLSLPEKRHDVRQLFELTSKSTEEFDIPEVSHFDLTRESHSS